jgi:hypothetical protein
LPIPELGLGFGGAGAFPQDRVVAVLPHPLAIFWPRIFCRFAPRV